MNEDEGLKWVLGTWLVFMLAVIAAGAFGAFNESTPKITVSEATIQACLNAGRTPVIEVDAVARTVRFRCEEKPVEQ